MTIGSIYVRLINCSPFLHQDPSILRQLVPGMGCARPERARDAGNVSLNAFTTKNLMNSEGVFLFLGHQLGGMRMS